MLLETLQMFIEGSHRSQKCCVPWCLAPMAVRVCLGKKCRTTSSMTLHYLTLPKQLPVQLHSASSGPFPSPQTAWHWSILLQQWYFSRTLSHTVPHYSSLPLTTTHCFTPPHAVWNCYTGITLLQTALHYIDISQTCSNCSKPSHNNYYTLFHNYPHCSTLPHSNLIYPHL